MASPFELFRENQKTLLALLFIFAMIAFMMADMLTSQDQNLPMLGLILGMAIFTFVGVFMKKPIQYAIGGAVGGLLAGLIATQFGVLTPSEQQIRTKFGVVTDDRLQKLLEQRQTVNQFMAGAMEKIGQQPNRRAISFGFPSDVEDVVMGEVFREIGRKQGIVIDNAAVSRFIDEQTAGKLTREGYEDVLSELRISDAILMSYLRSELLARAATDTIFPRGSSTPLQFWEHYKKVNETQSLQTVAIPVASFADGIKDPGDETLKKFFDQYREVEPAPGTIGFMQPRQIQLAYLEASYLDLESKVPAVTDAEVEEYYETNKEILYKNRSVPEDGDPFSPPGSGNPNVPFLPDFDSLKTPADDPVKAEKPENATETPPSEEKKTDEPKTEEAPKSEEPAEKSDAEKPESTDKPAEAPAEDNGACFDETPSEPEKLAEKTEEKPAAETPAAETPAAAESADAPESAVDPDAPLVAPKPGDLVERPEYRELDDFLRSEIRDQLLLERTRKLQEELAEKAVTLMTQLSKTYFELQNPLEPPTTDAEKAEQKKAVAAFVEDARKKLKAFAETNGMTYQETGLLGQDELRASGDHPVGSAFVGLTMQSMNSTPVGAQFFLMPPEALYEPQPARSFEPNSIYAVWKTADVAAHVPEFTEAGIREEVLEAWKTDQARPKAEARAKELVERLKGAKESWSELLADETITGETEQVQLTTRITEPFSWIRLQSVPTQFGIEIPQPALSEVSAIENIDNEFMRQIFAEMENGDVGVVPNSDKSIYYVVEIRNRKFAGQTDPASAEGKANLEAQYTAFIQTDLFMGNFFSPSPYMMLESTETRALSMAWLQKFREEYEVQIPSYLLAN